MGPFIPSFAILKPKVERFSQDMCGMSVRDKYMYILFLQKICIQYNVHKSVTMKHY